jgi:Icc-related predicted phosphoesterase
LPLDSLFYGERFHKNEWAIRLRTKAREGIGLADLHGQTDRYDNLVSSIVRDRPAAVFLGGDLLPRSAFSALQSGHVDFVHEYLVPAFTRTRDALGLDSPDIFLILGNDDPRREEEAFIVAAADGLWHYIHGQKLVLGEFRIYGLAHVPPTPFLLKDWERYDVSRYVPPGLHLS